MSATEARPILVVDDDAQMRMALSEAIQRTLEMVKDPAHSALELWAGALADMGLGDTGVDEPPGLSYLRAMDSFKGTPSNLQGQA